MIEDQGTPQKKVVQCLSKEHFFFTINNVSKYFTHVKLLSRVYYTFWGHAETNTYGDFLLLPSSLRILLIIISIIIIIIIIIII